MNANIMWTQIPNDSAKFMKKDIRPERSFEVTLKRLSKTGLALFTHGSAFSGSSRTILIMLPAVSINLGRKKYQKVALSLKNKKHQKIRSSSVS